MLCRESKPKSTEEGTLVCPLIFITKFREGGTKSNIWNLYSHCKRHKHTTII